MPTSYVIMKHCKKIPFQFLYGQCLQMQFILEFEIFTEISDQKLFPLPDLQHCLSSKIFFNDFTRANWLILNLFATKNVVKKECFLT